MDEERRASLAALERRLGLRFREVALLDRALTHRSFLNQPDLGADLSNEVLEFLGDAVLNLAVGHLLLQVFPEAREGLLSKKRSHLVKQNSLVKLSKALQLQDHLLLGKGELASGGKKKVSILANAYEALIGAVYLDAGFDQVLEFIRRQVEEHFGSEMISHAFDDHKSFLQEQAQGTHGCSPEYRVLQESGPDHDKQFQASVTLGDEILGIGWGKSKKQAEQEAAKEALRELDDRKTSAK